MEYTRPSLCAAMVGSAFIGVFASIPVCMILLVFGGMLNDFRLPELIISGLLAGILGGILSRILIRGIQSQQGSMAVFGWSPTLMEVVPATVICMAAAALTMGDALWLIWGGISGAVGIIPLLLITKPWNQKVSDAEYRERSGKAKESIRKGFDNIRSTS